MLLRPASIKDIPWLASAIIACEKSGTPRCGLAGLLGISEPELQALLVQWLQQMPAGCEWSVESFWILEDQSGPVACSAVWEEGIPKPSAWIKGALLMKGLSSALVKNFQSHSPLVADFMFPRESGALQLEYVYVASNAQGKGYGKKLLNELMRKFPGQKIQVQLFGNNAIAEKLYQKLGFQVAGRVDRNHAFIQKHYPSTAKILMEFIPPVPGN